MAIDNKIYTWIDVQDHLESYFEQEENQKWLENINFRAYWDGLNISFFYDKEDNFPKNESSIIEKLESIFSLRFIHKEDYQYIELEGSVPFPVFMEQVDKDEITEIPLKPSLGRVSFLGSKEKKEIHREANKSPFFFAFHSFKGGVGRTLHAISLAIELAEKHKVLLIDADFEAPGITWLIDQSPISFADFLAMIHGSKEHEKAINYTAEALKLNMYENNNLFILPAFRSLKNGNMPILEIRPEHIFKFSNEPFILTDILEDLATKLDVDYIIIDLRAGVSELSSGWFFDPRINKIFVTTLSSQSVLGTAKMFEVLSKFDKQNNIKHNNLPFLIISQVPKESIKITENNWTDTYVEGILSELRKQYQKSFIELSEFNQQDIYEELTDEEIIGRVVAPITLFSVENDNLKSLPNTWEEVSKLIVQNNLHKDVAKISKLSPSILVIEEGEENFEKSRDELKKIANDLIFAEKIINTDFLVTKSIKNLMSDFRNQIPIAVVVGAKGAGKTFLYKQIVYAKNWQNFVKKEFSNAHGSAYILPITIPQNLSNTVEFTTLSPEIKQITNSSETQNIWAEYIKPDVEDRLRENLTNSQWREKWLDYMAWAAGFQIKKDKAGRAFLEYLKKANQHILAVFDGLEDLFKQFNNSAEQQKALESLLQDVPNWLESQTERHLGLIVFVRRDLVSSAITQNLGQFLSKYEKFELRWDSVEALRLVHWILNKYKIFNKDTFTDWEKSLQEKNFTELITPLHKLWGMRMASDSSNEAYTHNWILGSLANLKKEVQSRDIVRFLDFAATKSLGITDRKILDLYKDRAFYPAAIRQSIEEVGREKIEEVKKENEPLKQVLELLETKTQTIEFPCKPDEIKEILPEEKQIKILEDNGVVIFYNGEYYMAEIYRKGMGFDYSRKGKPKVLYF